MKQTCKRRGKRGRTVCSKTNSNSLKLNNESQLWSIYQLNIRGFNSKKCSFESILSSINPSPNLIVISESHLKFHNKANIPGYHSYSRNWKDQIQGGIITSVKQDEAKECLKVSEGKNTNEFIITRHSKFQTPINIINVYSCQENRTGVNQIREQWQEIVEEIIKIETKKENLILLGDFNRHVGTLIEGNHDKVTDRVNLVKELLENGEYVLLNSLASKVT